MSSEVLKVILAGLIVFVVCTPFVVLLSKWKKEMEEELKLKEKDGKKENDDE